MKAGELAKVVRSPTISALADNPSLGKTGIVLSRFEHPSATCELEWFTVLIEGQPRHFREDYLKAI